MKPVTLKLAGLHSFREAQVVDFEKLCEVGLFGIFGPTGSGKSTVLDALTLALYGKVERATYGTQGILNHAEDRVVVEFTFELDQPEGRKRYRVERVYRRSGDSSVTSGGARLIEITNDDEKPIAEKSKVTEEITSMLGLTVDDFTRAVVLPQGKFDEFLKKIKPLDRRRMLERLFGLYEYGDRLRQKVDFRLSEVSNKLASVLGELEGLGDASDETLDSTQKKFDEANRMVNEVNVFLKRLEKEHGEFEKIWTWQEEKFYLDQKLNDLLEHEPEIDASRLKLDAAIRAGKVIPFSNEEDNAKKVFTAAQENFNTNKDKLSLAELTAEKAEATFETVSLQRQEVAPVLLGKKERLIQAVDLEREAGGLEKEKSGMENTLKELEEEKASNGVFLQNQQKDKASLEREIKILKERISMSQVDSEWRKKVSAALLAFQRWEKAEEEKSRAQVNREKKEELLSDTKKLLAGVAVAEQKTQKFLEQAVIKEEELREGCPEDEIALQDSLQELERLRAKIGEITRLSQAIYNATTVLKNKNKEFEKNQEAFNNTKLILTEVEHQRDDARQKVQLLEEELNELNRHNMAYHLASLLEEEVPCPVCGSADHPSPAVTDKVAEIANIKIELQEAQNSLETAQNMLEKVQQDYSVKAEKLKSSTEAAQEAQDRLVVLNSEIEAARGTLPIAWNNLSPAELEKEIFNQETLLNQRRKALTDWRKELVEAQQSLREAQDSYSKAKAARTGAESTFQGREIAWREATENELVVTGEADKCLKNLDNARGDIASDKIDEEQRRIERLDSERSDLEKKLIELDKKLAESNLEVEKLAVRDGELAVQISRNQAGLLALSVQLEKKESEIIKITGGESALLLLDQTETQLKDLSEMEQQAQGEAKRAIKEKNELGQALAASLKALSIAEEWLENSRKKLDKILDELCFVTRNEAEQALLNITEQRNLQIVLEEYDAEKKRLNALSNNLAKKLDGRTLSGEEWQTHQENLAGARCKQEEALTARGAAFKEYEKLKQDNDRWKELTQRASEIKNYKQKLEVLKDLFRGNAFVDFLAEEQLIRVSNDASFRLGQLTKHRYALEVDSEGGFIIRDEANGGIKRPVSTLSGGETFVTSLALALALSMQIQLKGSYPLEFFFLDEGFGTLDPDLLEVVVSTLEGLRLEHLNIGVISHVPELKNRLPRRLIVYPAEASGTGSHFELEMA